MSLELIAIIAIVLGIGVAFLFFVLAKRVLKIAIRLTIAFLIFLIVAGTAIWFTWFGSSNENRQSPQNRPTNSRRSNNR